MTCRLAVVNTVASTGTPWLQVSLGGNCFSFGRQGKEGTERRRRRKKKKRSIDFSLTCREGEWREGGGEKRDAMTNRENWRA